MSSTPLAGDRASPPHRPTAVTPAATAPVAPGDQQTVVANLIRALHGYLRANLGAFPTLAQAVQALREPVRAFGLGNVTLAQAQAIGVYQLITQLRVSQPAMPVP